MSTRRKYAYYLSEDHDQFVQRLKLELALHGVTGVYVDNSTLMRSLITLFNTLRKGPTGDLVMKSYAHEVLEDIRANPRTGVQGRKPNRR